MSTPAINPAPPSPTTSAGQREQLLTFFVRGQEFGTEILR